MRRKGGKKIVEGDRSDDDNACNHLLMVCHFRAHLRRALRQKKNSYRFIP